MSVSLVTFSFKKIPGGADTRFFYKRGLYAIRRPGGYCEVAAPDPILNSEVKRLRADGTLT